MNAASVAAYIDFIRLGFPNRLPIVEVYNIFESKLPQHGVAMNQTNFVRNLLLSLGLKQTDFTFGTHWAFLRKHHVELVAKLTKPDAIFMESTLNSLVRYNRIQKWWNHLFAWSKFYHMSESIFHYLFKNLSVLFTVI